MTANAPSICIMPCVQIIPRLQVEPVTLGHAEVVREPTGDIGGDRPLSLDDLVHAPRRNSDVFSQMPDADSFRGEEVFK